METNTKRKAFNDANYGRDAYKIFENDGLKQDRQKPLINK